MTPSIRPTLSSMERTQELHVIPSIPTVKFSGEPTEEEGEEQAVAGAMGPEDVVKVCAWVVVVVVVLLVAEETCWSNDDDDAEPQREDEGIAASGVGDDGYGRRKWGLPCVITVPARSSPSELSKQPLPSAGKTSNPASSMITFIRSGDVMEGSYVRSAVCCSRETCVFTTPLCSKSLLVIERTQLMHVIPSTRNVQVSGKEPSNPISLMASASAAGEVARSSYLIRARFSLRSTVIAMTPTLLARLPSMDFTHELHVIPSISTTHSLSSLIYQMKYRSSRVFALWVDRKGKMGRKLIAGIRRALVKDVQGESEKERQKKLQKEGVREGVHVCI